MNALPFLTFHLRNRKQALVARHRARQLAQLLSFDDREQACIAAGAFLIACQALERSEGALLCFSIEQSHLVVCAKESKTRHSSSEPVSTPISGNPPKIAAVCLSKTLPQGLVIDEADLGWLVQKIESKATNELFEEVVKQNHDVLFLLHELRKLTPSVERKSDENVKSSAA
jgi:hypothetical protein